MIWTLLAWSAIAAVALGRRIRRREDDAAVAVERPDVPALAGFARRDSATWTTEVAARRPA